MAVGLVRFGAYRLQYMPFIDSYKMATILRHKEANGSLKRISIMAVTANALPGEADKYLANSMDDYIQKPIDMSVLEYKINQLFDD